MAEQYELVIFDCDGVLVDSERLAIRVDVQVLAAIGWPLTEEDVIERFVGRSDEYMRSEIEAHLGRRLPEDWDAAFSRLYLEAFEAELEPVPGVVEALDRISSRVCVASSGSHTKIRFSLERTGLLDRFDDRIFSASDVLRGKPAPDLFLHAARQMDVDPRRCAVVEDSVFGVEAALSADMDVYAFAGSVTPAERLAVDGAVVFHDMAALPDLLAERGEPR